MGGISGCSGSEAAALKIRWPYRWRGSLAEFADTAMPFDHCHTSRMRSPKPSSDADVRSKLTEGLFSHFFVNLALAADADETLTALGLGRPHHRILSIAAGLPGMTVNQLLEILRFSHQNARLPMRKLEEDGLIELRPGAVDKRQRTLHATAKGRKLLERAQARQWVRLERALRDCGQEDFAAFLRVQQAMLDPKDAQTVGSMLTTGAPPC